jgi:hypothetical protein
MNRLIVLALCLFPGLAAAGRTLDPVEPQRIAKPDVTYRVDGDVLIVATTITIYDAPHVVITSLDPADILPPILRYTVIQNADHFLEGKKTVPIEWRFKAKETGSRPHMIKGQWLVLYTNELNQLGGAALKLTKGW